MGLARWEQQRSHVSVLWEDFSCNLGKSSRFLGFIWTCDLRLSIRWIQEESWITWKGSIFVSSLLSCCESRRWSIFKTNLFSVRFALHRCQGKERLDFKSWRILDRIRCIIERHCLSERTWFHSKQSWYLPEKLVLLAIQR